MIHIEIPSNAKEVRAVFADFLRDVVESLEEFEPREKKVTSPSAPKGRYTFLRKRRGRDDQTTRTSEGLSEEDYNRD